MYNNKEIANPIIFVASVIKFIGKLFLKKKQKKGKQENCVNVSACMYRYHLFTNVITDRSFKLPKRKIMKNMEEKMNKKHCKQQCL